LAIEDSLTHVVRLNSSDVAEIQSISRR